CQRGRCARPGGRVEAATRTNGLCAQLRAGHRGRRRHLHRSLLDASGRMIEPSSHTPLLTALVVIPFVGAAVVALLPRRRPELMRLVALVFTMVAGALSVAVLVEFQKGQGGFQLVDHHSWIASFGISWTLGIDGISLFLVVLTGVLFPLAILG